MGQSNNPLKSAPHSADVSARRLKPPLRARQTAYPLKSLRDAKQWPPIGRADNVCGDRNVMCSGVGMEAYQ